MIGWEIGEVLHCGYCRSDYQEVHVLLKEGKEAKAVHYTDSMPFLNVGDTVLLNTTAVDLHLGSGGSHVVHALLNRSEYTNAQSGSGHIMKLRYTSLQRAVLAVEEKESPYHALFCEPRNLEGMPVLIGELHSMLPAAVSWFRHLQKADGSPALKIVFLMSDGGALPLNFSHHAAALKEQDWLQGTVTFGNAYGGDYEAVNKFTALIAARYILQADIAIVTMGPGITGTETLMGSTGMEVGELINAVSVMGGTPIVVPRVSFADPRLRHQGISHHTLTALSKVAIRGAIVPLPDYLRGNDKIIKQLADSGCAGVHDVHWMHTAPLEAVEASFDAYALPITTMERGLYDDPDFFLAICAAVQYARNRIRDEQIK